MARAAPIAKQNLAEMSQVLSRAFFFSGSGAMVSM